MKLVAPWGVERAFCPPTACFDPASLSGETFAQPVKVGVWFDAAARGAPQFLARCSTPKAVVPFVLCVYAGEKSRGKANSQITNGF